MSKRTINSTRAVRKDYQPKADRHCERCGEKLVPRIFPSSGEEHPCMFKRRRFCSLKCANTRGRKGTSRTQVMIQARAKALKTRCECCGGKKKLAIHHVNENWRDDSAVNLQTLCVYCHSQWHGLHRKLKIKCFARMPRLVDLPVETYQKISWGKFDPRQASNAVQR